MAAVESEIREEAIQSNQWFSGPCGVREVLAVAFPLILSTGSFSLLLFVDRVFLMWYKADAMAAAMPAGMLYWSAICFPIGITSYLNAFVAQYYGARRYERIGAVMAQGIWFAVACTPLFFAFLPLAPWFFTFIGHEGSIREFEVQFFEVLLFGGGATVLAAAQSSFFSGRGQTLVVMSVDVSATVLNAVLDYALIFGYWGFPQWGIAGAAWATVIAQWTKVIAYALLMNRAHLRHKYQLRLFGNYDREIMARLLRFGAPSGFQLLIEGSAFTIFVLLIGNLGRTATAATTLAFSINNVAFIPMVGLSIAITSLVGRQLGAERPDLAARATWTGLAIAILYNGLFALAYVLTPAMFMRLHQLKAGSEDFSAIQPVAIHLLRFVAAYCMFDAMQIVFVGAVKGAGDTRFVLWTTLWVGVAALTIGKVGAIVFNAGLYWWWSVCTAWICCLGIIYLWRFLQGRWRTMRVIEPTVPN